MGRRPRTLHSRPSGSVPGSGHVLVAAEFGVPVTPREPDLAFDPKAACAPLRLASRTWGCCRTVASSRRATSPPPKTLFDRSGPLRAALMFRRDRFDKALATLFITAYACRRCHRTCGDSRAGQTQDAVGSEDQQAKQKLIECALKLFAEHGRDRVSVRQIAAEAGVTHGSIRYHFGTKDKLYLAAVTHLGIEGALDAIPKMPTTPGSLDEAKDQLRRFVHSFVGFQASVGENRVAALGLMQAEVSRDGGPDKVFYHKVIKPGHERLKAIVSRIRPDIEDDKTLEILTFNIIFQCVMIRIGRGTIMKLLGTRSLTKRDLALIADLIVNVALGGLEALDAP